jgi:RHS repeat-associated protein
MGSNEAREFDTPCDLAKFMSEAGANVLEANPGETVNELNSYLEGASCTYRFTGIPVAGTDGVGTPGVGTEGDTPEDQQPPDVQTDGELAVDRNGIAPGDDSRDPTDAVHSSANPASEGELKERLVNEGATNDEADEGVEHARRGDPEEGSERSTHSGERNITPAQGGDPVDLSSGLFLIASVDLDVPTPLMPIQFVRRYQSGRPYYGPWGYNWDHNWNVYLRELSNGNVVRWNGQMHEDLFTYDGANFEPPRGVFEKLERGQGPGLTYILKYRGGTCFNFEHPPGWTNAERIPLVSIEDRHGNTVTIEYDAENLVKSVLDEDGRGLFFFYGKCGLLTTVEDHVGRKVTYSFDYDYEHMVEVLLPKTSDFPDGSRTAYIYDPFAAQMARRHNILRIVDHENNCILENEYSKDPSDAAFNRIVRQSQGGFLFNFEYKQIQYVPQDENFVNLPAMRTSVCYPDGSLWTHTFNYRGDLLDERFRLNRDKSFRVVIVKREYDSQGNLTARVNPDGSRSEYTYDHINNDPLMRSNLLKEELRASPVVPVPSRIMFKGVYNSEYQLLKSIISENGVETRFLYDFDVAPSPLNRGHLVQIEWPDATLPDGTIQQSVTRFETNGRGQVEAVISPEGTRSEIDYEPAGTPLTGFLMSNRDDVAGVNESTYYTYDAYGFPYEVTMPGGAVHKSVYNAMGQIEEESLPAVQGVIDKNFYKYNAQHRLASVAVPRGSYNDGTITGGQIINTYQTNPLGHLVEATAGSNTAEPRQYLFHTNYEGRICKETDPEGRVTQRHFDERGLLLEETVAYGTPEAITNRFVYDTSGRRIIAHHHGGISTGFEYDPWGRLSRTSMANGTLVENRWGAYDMLESRTLTGDPGDGTPARNLSRTAFEYDERGRLVKEIIESFASDPAVAVPLETVKWYDRDGRCVKRVGVRGAERFNEYDGLNRLTRSVGPLGNIETNIYGPEGLPRRITNEDIDAGGGKRTRWVEFEHDERARLVRILLPSGTDAVQAWDARDLLSERRSETGVVTRWTHGLLGERLEQITDPPGLALSYKHEYNLIGEPVRFIDPTGEVTTVERDTLGRINKVTLADGGEITRTFNPEGGLARVDTPDGSATNFTYDGVGRTAQMSAIPSAGRLPVPVHTFGYDGLDRLVSAQAGGSSVNRLFDSMGRLLEEETNGRKFERSYDDLVGSCILRYPDQREEEQSWNLAGRIDQIKLIKAGNSAVGANGGAAGTVLLSVSYLGSTRLSEMHHSNGVISEWHHDDEGRALRIEHSDAAGGSMESVRYRYNDSNQRRVLQLTGNPAENHLYDYDNNNRLVQWKKDFPLPALLDSDTQAAQDVDIANAEVAAATAQFFEEYTLDDSDTRDSVRRLESGAISVLNYIKDVDHKVVRVGTDDITYDADGRRLTDASRKITYDALGRVAQIHSADGLSLLASHEYDPISRWSGGMVGVDSIRRFYFSDMCLQEETPAGLVLCQRTYNPLHLMPVIETRVNGPLHLHLNGHQDLVLVTNSAGNPVERYRYDIFGQPTVFDTAGFVRPQSAVGLNPWFGGMQYIPGTDLYYTPERHYDPSTGLFIARDPLLHRLSSSPYVFVRHDPANLLDPTGDILPLLVAGLVVGVIGAVVGGVGRAMIDPDADAWDIAASVAIGFGAGFIGGVTFGAASTAIGGALVTAGVSGGTASVIGGIGGGAISGGLSGSTSGFFTGLYEGRGTGHALDMALDGAYVEGVSGMAAGAVGGGLFHGAMRLGTIPRGMWAATRGASQATARSAVLPSVIGRGMLSPYGAVGAVGIGYGSAVSGGTVRNLLGGEDIDDAFMNAQSDGLVGAGLGVFSMAHPLTSRYWSVRLKPSVAARVQSRRPGRVHHQRNVAQYPELATPTPRVRGVSPMTNRMDGFMNMMTEGNISGSQSTYGSPNSLSHTQMHNAWRSPGQGGSWTNIPTHGPWTPAWIVNYLTPDHSSDNQKEKES